MSLVTVASKTEAQTARRERKARDWYVEPAWCTELLLDAECFPQPIWDPCAGQGTILDVCEARGLGAFGSDIRPQSGDVAEHDFLGEPLSDAESIICNPPYDKAQKFAEHALTIPGVLRVAMLCRLSFLASQKRKPWFESTPLDQVLVLSRRPSMPPGEMLAAGVIEPKGGAVDFAWFVWSWSARRHPIIRWLA